MRKTKLALVGCLMATPAMATTYYQENFENPAYNPLPFDLGTGNDTGGWFSSPVQHDFVNTPSIGLPGKVADGFTEYVPASPPALHIQTYQIDPSTMDFTQPFTMISDVFALHTSKIVSNNSGPGIHNEGNWGAVGSTNSWELDMRASTFDPSATFSFTDPDSFNRPIELGVQIDPTTSQIWGVWNVDGVWHSGTHYQADPDRLLQASVIRIAQDYRDPGGGVQGTGVQIDNFQVYSGLTLPDAPKWSHNGPGNWSNSTNWQAGIPEGGTANFTDAITAPTTITLDGPHTVSMMQFDNTNSYTIAGNVGVGTLTFDVPTGSTRLNVYSGNHTISAPVALPKSLTVTVQSSSSVLTVSNGLDATTSGVSLLKMGSGLLKTKQTRVDTLNVAEGTLQVASSSGAADSVSRVKGLSIGGATDAWTSQLDLTDNAMVVDYDSTPNPSPLATIANQIKAGFAAGSWSGNGISSSTAASASQTSHHTALGYAEASSLFTAFPATFRGQQVDNTSVLIRYTYSGDANLDGVVNALDFNALASHYGAPSAQTWVTGDFNYDSIVNSSDFDALAMNFGQSIPSSAEISNSAAEPLGILVPEPVSLGILAFSGLLLLQPGSRRRKWK